MIELDGIDIYFDEKMASLVQYRFPRAKSRKIQREWRKRPGNYRLEPWREILKVGKMWFVHPGYWPEYCRENVIRLEANALRGRVVARRPLRPEIRNASESSWGQDKAGYPYLAGP